MNGFVLFFLVIIGVVLGVAFLVGGGVQLLENYKSRGYGDSLEEILNKSGFNADKKRASSGGAIAVDKDNRKIFLFGHNADEGRLYDFSDVNEWEIYDEPYQSNLSGQKKAGVEADSPLKWCLEVYLDTPETPRHEIWFGGQEQVAKDWNAYLKSVM